MPCERKHIEAIEKAWVGNGSGSYVASVKGLSFQTEHLVPGEGYSQHEWCRD